MKIKTTIASICATIFTSTIFAAPVEFDTPDAHIVVMRALDSWSGDNSASEDSLEEVAKHEGGFQLARGKKVVSGYPALFGFNGYTESSPIFQGVIAALKPLNFKLAQNKTMFKVDNPIQLDPAKLADFANFQRVLYKNLVISEGNPANLHNSVSAKKFFSGILSIGTVVVGGAKYGSLGSESVLNSSIPSDIYQAGASGRASGRGAGRAAPTTVLDGRAALTPLDLPSFDASSYKSIDVRRVIQGNNERVGQVIIAYKADKTDDAENAALIKAIISLTGADTTVEAIKQARAEDLAKRQAIWDTCVGEGKCKN